MYHEGGGVTNVRELMWLSGADLNRVKRIQINVSRRLKKSGQKKREASLSNLIAANQVSTYS